LCAPGDVDGVRNRERIRAHEGHAGGFHGHVRAGAHGEAEIGSGERRASLIPSPTMATCP
jgi:hypothetical protein